MSTTAPLTAAERRLIASRNSNLRWARCDDRRAATEPARKAARSRFEALVDPEGTLDPAERSRRASYLQRARMQELALASARARRAKAAKR